MRNISCESISKCVAKLCVEANLSLPQDLRRLIDTAIINEKSPLGIDVLRDLRENYLIAEKESLPICQDTGMAVIFAEIGQDVHIEKGDFEAAINEGVRRGYKDGYLRKSVVADPLRRINTNDNTPAVLHTRIVPGDKIKITVAPKGFGSENQSTLKMFLPTSTPDDIIDFIVETVKLAGSNPCPPMVLGVGLGGTIEMAALIAKKALLRSAGQKNPDAFYAEMEKTALERINALGIGPQGFGGSTTALAVFIEAYPTHIAGLPCVVNIGCHVTRHSSAVI